jgi:molybdopterin converting factor small subunit
MAISVRLPAMLRSGADTITITEPVRTIAQLVDALGRAQPGLAGRLEDTMFNFAVNDEMLLHRVQAHPLKDGDVVEIVPAISGGRL